MTGTLLDRWRSGAVTRRVATSLPNWQTALGCIATGVLLAASLPPWGFWPLAFAGAAVLDFLLADRPATSRAARLGSCAFVLLAITLFWIKDLTLPGYVIAVLVFSLFFAALAPLIPPGRGRHVALPAIWAVAEMIKGRWPFGGVPISDLAIGQADGPLVGLARLGGVPLLSGTAIAVGVVVAALIKRSWFTAAGFSLGIVALLMVASVAPTGVDTGEQVDVAVVQGGGEQGTHAIDSDMDEVFDVHMEAAETIEPPVDLVLWPEDVVDLSDGDIADPNNSKGRRLSKLARDLDATVIAGVVQNLDDAHFRNYSVVVEPDGSFGDRYDKVRRVPFGEYVPFRPLVEPFAGPALTTRDAVRGEGPAVLSTDQGPIGTAISWEVFFGGRARSAIRSGGEIFANPTNGSSFSLSLVQSQQIAASQLRAVETGRWVLQAAPTGFSGVISPSGEVLQRTGVSEQKVLRAVVPRRTGETFYVRYGELPVTILLLVMVGSAWGLARRPRGTAISALDPKVS